MSASKLTVLHRKAMRLSHEADAALNPEEMLRLRTLAFEAEKSAAETLYSSFSEEPARSVLFRSAAVLAMECNNLSEAGRLAAAGLSGLPPGRVADELHRVWERAFLARHLGLRNVVLADDEYQLALSGRGVGPGVASEQSFLPRYKATQSLILRTRERLKGWDFLARLRAETKDAFEFFFAVPREASFAITIKIGRNLSLPGSEAGKVIDEVSTCMALYESGDREQLERRIDEPYRKNFDALAGQIAPDGRDVESVSFTTFRDGNERTVAITRPRVTPSLASMSPPEEIEEIQKGDRANNVTVRGTLIYASSQRKGKKKTIKVLTPEGGAVKVAVSAELMHDVVRPYYEAEVIVTLGRSKQGFFLVDIVGV
jgi:hypothetical protein